MAQEGILFLTAIQEERPMTKEAITPEPIMQTRGRAVGGRSAKKWTGSPRV